MNAHTSIGSYRTLEPRSNMFNALVASSVGVDVLMLDATLARHTSIAGYVCRRLYDCQSMVELPTLLGERTSTA